MADLPNSFVEKIDDRPTIRWIVGFGACRWPIMAHGQGDPVLRADRRIILETEIGYCLACYERLMPETAQQIVRFYREREKGASIAASQKTSELPAPIEISTYPASSASASAHCDTQIPPASVDWFK